jgi:hypothetical protein
MASGRVSRLSPEAIEEIRSSSESQKVLADKHKVTQQYVSYIRSGDRLRPIVVK